jgi:lipopolysaccharide assembly outer membrane protein LptD (OstA)
MRNKLQTKRNGQVWDFIDIDTYTYYRVEPEEYEEDFSDLYYEARTKPFDWMAWDFDGQYDWYGNRTEEFNTQLAILARDKSSLGCEYRYERDERDQFQIEVNLFPEDKWSFLSYWRFDFDEHDLAEQVYEVGHKFDCLGLSVGYQQKDSDDWNVMMKVWLLAFPSAKIGAQAGAYDF